MTENSDIFQPLFRRVQEWVQNEIQTRLTQAGIRGRTIDASNIRGVISVAPAAHKTSHQDGGGDEISVAGLSGVLADAQTAAAHAASHQNGGGDEISVAGLSGQLADGQTPVDHDHSGDAGDGGTFDAANLTSGAAGDGTVLTADGAGGAAWEAATATDADAIHDNVAGEIAAITEKISLVSGDMIVIEDSEAANAKKMVQVGNLPGGAGGAPTDAEYVVETANGSLSAEVVLGTTVITQTAYASRQAATKAGRLWLPTDGWQLARDDGAAWGQYGPIFGPLTPPAYADFSWDNQGAAAASDSKGGLLFTCANSATNQHTLYKSAPAAPYTLIVGFIPMFFPLTTSAQVLTVGWRKNSDALKVSCQIYNTNIIVNRIAKINANGSFNSSYRVSANWWYTGGIMWFKLVDDNTNRVFSVSSDSQNWQQVHSVGRTDFITADQLTLGLDANGNADSFGMYVVHWAVS